MKTRLFILSLIFALFVSVSCSDDDVKWDDTIKLSIKDVEFDAKAHSVTIKTEGNWWWVTCITVDGKVFLAPECINGDSCNYTIKNDCFVVERRDEHTLFISVDENSMNKERVISVGLEAGDYFDWVTVTQAGN